MRNSFLYLIYLVIAVLCYACARPAAPGGGPVDKTPPSIIKDESTPNFSTNFSDREITLTFDEFITVKNTSKEVNISPPMLNRPTITSKGKSLSLKFNDLEPLRDSVTYTINFGKAISDYRANNTLENYRFIFSTGDYIDSLSVKGSVTDVLTQKPPQDVIIMLYDNLDDSIVYKERPFYFSTLDKEGKFILENLKSDTFQIFALKDLNANYYYDQEAESLAFIDSTFILTDSSFFDFDLEISEPKQARIVKEKLDKTQGELFFVMNQEADFTVFSFIDTVQYQTLVVKDTFKVWYQSQDTILNYIIENDTSKIVMAKTKAVDQPRSYRIVENQNGQRSKAIAPSQSAKIKLNLPINRTIQDSIMLRDTAKVALANFAIKKDSLDPSLLYFSGLWTSNMDYELTILPGAVENYFGESNRDTIVEKIFVSQKSKFGTIVLNYKELDTSIYYVTKLINKQKKEIVRSFSGDTTAMIKYPLMRPGDYSLEILLDQNNNGVWDGSNYQTKSKAEQVVKKKLDELRADWELSVDIKL